MNIPDPKKCPVCSNLIPEGTAEGLCPTCLLKEAGTPASAYHSRMKEPDRTELREALPDYRIGDLIGRGGMGFVYRAEKIGEGNAVALKILPKELAADPEFAERFDREGRTLSQLSHPNIVGIHGHGQAGPFFYLCMELVDGPNLRQAMAAGDFTPEQALSIVPDLCSALTYAHQKGVLHRDIKPENILLDEDGHARIVDFGIAKLVGDEGLHPTLTLSGAQLGTPNYMAPEQIERKGNIDHRADIYSLGVVLYELLTGGLPIGRFAPPSAHSPVHPDIDEIVFRALEKDRLKRQQSADEVSEALKSAGREGPALPSHAGASQRKTTPWQAFAGIFATVINIPPAILATVIMFMVVQEPSWNPAPSEALVSFTTWGISLALTVLSVIFGLSALKRISSDPRRCQGARLAMAATLSWPLFVFSIFVMSFSWLILVKLLGIGGALIPALMMIPGIGVILFDIHLAKRAWAVMIKPLDEDARHEIEHPSPMHAGTKVAVWACSILGGMALLFVSSLIVATAAWNVSAKEAVKEEQQELEAMMRAAQAEMERELPAAESVSPPAVVSPPKTTTGPLALGSAANSTPLITSAQQHTEDSPNLAHSDLMLSHDDHALLVTPVLITRNRTEDLHGLAFWYHKSDSPYHQRLQVDWRMSQSLQGGWSLQSSMFFQQIDKGDPALPPMSLELNLPPGSNIDHWKSPEDHQLEAFRPGETIPVGGHVFQLMKGFDEQGKNVATLSLRVVLQPATLKNPDEKKVHIRAGSNWQEFLNPLE